jgi:hypothetical protein
VIVLVNRNREDTDIELMDNWMSFSLMHFRMESYAIFQRLITVVERTFISGAI